MIRETIIKDLEVNELDPNIVYDMEKDLVEDRTKYHMLPIYNCYHQGTDVFDDM